MKKSIIIYADCIAILEELTYEQAGKLFKAILSYVNEEPVTETEGDPAVNIAFKVLKTQIDRDALKYAIICERRRENINKRWHKEGQNADDTKGTKSIQMNTNVNKSIQMDYDNENDNDNDNEFTKVNNKKETPTNVGGKKEKTAAAKAATPSTVKSIGERQKAFYDTLRPYVNKYPKDMLRAFYDWWSEPNRSRTKLRVELEKTWDLSRRLATWNRKDEERKFNNGKSNQSDNSAEQRLNDAAAIIARRLAQEGTAH